MGRPRSHGPETAYALLAAAEQVVDADGPGALSVRRVADEAGTTTRAVYSLFGSKEGLLVALATHGFQLLASEVDAVPVTEDPLEDLVTAGAVVFRRFAVEHPVLFRIGFQHEAVTPDLVQQFDAARLQALEQLTARLERLASTGLLVGHPPMQAALYFHALCEGLAAIELRTALHGRGAERVWRAALRALLLGLGTHEAG